MAINPDVAPKIKVNQSIQASGVLSMSRQSTSTRDCFVFGGIFALFPSATSDYFGPKHLGVNYGWIFTAYGVAGILGPVVGGVLYDSTQQYLIPFVFAGTLCFIAASASVVVWLMSRQHLSELGAATG
jgi:MFS family permease